MKILHASYTHITVETALGEIFRPDTDDKFLNLVTPGKIFLPIKTTEGNLAVLTNGGNYKVVTTEDVYLTADGSPYNVAAYTNLTLAHNSTPTMGYYGPIFKTTAESETTFIIKNA
jgi:hypothetical protein